MSIAIVIVASIIAVAIYMSVRYVVDAWEVDSCRRNSIDRDTLRWQQKCDEARMPIIKE